MFALVSAGLSGGPQAPLVAGLQGAMPAPPARAESPCIEKLMKDHLQTSYY